MSLLARFQLEQGISLVPANTDEGPPPSQRGRTPTRSPRRSLPSSPHSWHFSRSRSPPVGWGSQTPPPGQGGRCWPRSGWLEFSQEERVLKRNKQHAQDVCRENSLEDSALDGFAQLNVPEMLITVYGKLLAVEHERQKDETHVFIHSEQFKEILKDRLRSCLLSPNLTAYLAELPENIWVFMKKNLSVFKIPPKALEDPELIEYIDSLVKDVLTKQRATIKSKLALSIKSGQHISLLAKALAQGGYYEVTTSQWARFAFLRASLGMFNQLVMESMAKTVEAAGSKISDNVATSTEDTGEQDDNPATDKGDSEDQHESSSKIWVSTDFWEYVDELLADIWTQAAEKHPTLEGRKEQIELFFTECLQADLKTHQKTKRGCPVPVTGDHVLSDWQRAIHQDLVWT